MVMTNTFYNDFDTETWEGRRAPADSRTDFQRDRDRIIHTSGFRRLQAKTQVFLSGEYDFYRTRLTHSLEVAQIGRSICNLFLRKDNSFLSSDFHVDSDLVEAVCLAHDLGHPPFGHAGERTLHSLMIPHGGFEGNAQTLRLLTETIYSDGTKRTGMQPTRALMDGVMKYKTLRRFDPKAKHHFLYDDQELCLEFIFDNDFDAARTKPGEELNAFRSIECQIMDWADNTAYSLNDLSDAIHAGFLNIPKVERWAVNSANTQASADTVEELLNIMKEGDINRGLSKKIAQFIDACQLQETSNFMSGRTNRYRYELKIAPEIEAQYETFSALARQIVFNSPQLHQLEFKGDRMLKGIFKAFQSNYISKLSNYHLLPRDMELLVRGEERCQNRARLISDHISGMTDGFAARTYRRLFDPTFGSIVDLI